MILYINGDSHAAGAEAVLLVQGLVVLADHEAHERTLQPGRELGRVLEEQGVDVVDAADNGGQGDLRTHIGGRRRDAGGYPAHLGKDPAQLHRGGARRLGGCWRGG